MEYYFSHLKCKNFRGLINFECEFDRQFNEISGDNGVGKTTVLSSILWCLFGKDLNDRKNFPITPIVNGVIQKEMVTEVELTLNNNFVINRTWDGSKTELKYGFIDYEGKKNLIKSTQSKFNEMLEEKFVSEKEFKALSNINYLPNLPWEELKNFIYSLIGEVTDEQVLESASFPLCDDFIRNLGSVALVNKLKQTKSILNDNLEDLETKINYATQLKIKYTSEKEELENLKVLKSQYEKDIMEYNEKSQLMNSLREQKTKLEIETTDLNVKNKNIENECARINQRIVELKSDYARNNFDIEKIRNEEFAIINNSLYQEQRGIIIYNSQKEQLLAELDEYKRIGEELKNKEVKVEKDTCSYCGSKLAKEVIEKTLNKMKDEQKKKLIQIKEKYDTCKLQISMVEQKVKEIELKVEEYKRQLKNVETKEYEIVEETDRQKEIKETISQLEKRLENISSAYELNEISIKKNNEEIEKIHIEELTPPIEIQEKLNEINEKLATSITLEKIENDIANMREEYEITLKQKDLNYRTEQELILFNETKGEILKEKIRQYFDLVEFITMKKRKDDSYEQCFDLSYKGIVYNELNSAQKIKVAIDLVLGIQKIKDKKIPILIDSVEVITRLPEYNTQTLVTRSVKQDIPKILLNGEAI